MDLSSVSTPTTLPKDSSFSAAASPYFASLQRKRQQKKMSITQTYYLAHTARKKLTREASRADHDLRLLVGHANLLDSLMLDLADAERDQERWFNQTVRGATKEEPRHIQWASTVVEEPEEDWDPEDASDLESEVSDSDSEDDSDFDENDFLEEEDDETDSDFEYDDEEDLDDLSLTRSPSRQSPPELLADVDDSSEDEATPPSPPQPTLEVFDEKAPTTMAIPLTPADQDSPHLFEPGYYVSQEQSTIIEAY
ncbi:hypothetical protein N7509_002617 [Penicillium cosmopolitanum]|uniref:Uncharacterized protein n=1 Tax=Penicillium cosmopolitanum TaxID=1131564 RepID=A0A9X0BDN2_9EURO|nr:uncharacterized protein N7509_002617 [Penicillium cosmopolitanum]KAJ5408734.1 hypothetical protein N7509_002617 [Penicillium cosmopolitanum]